MQMNYSHHQQQEHQRGQVHHNQQATTQAQAQASQHQMRSVTTNSKIDKKLKRTLETALGNDSSYNDPKNSAQHVNVRLAAAIKKDFGGKMREYLLAEQRKTMLEKELSEMRVKLLDKENSMQNRRIDVVSELRELELKGGGASEEDLLKEYSSLKDSTRNLKKEEEQLFAGLKKKYAEEVHALKRDLEAKRERSESHYEGMVVEQNVLYQKKLKIMLEKMRITIQTVVDQFEKYKSHVAKKKKNMEDEIELGKAEIAKHNERVNEKMREEKTRHDERNLVEHRKFVNKMTALRATLDEPLLKETSLLFILQTYFEEEKKKGFKKKKGAASEQTDAIKELMTDVRLDISQLEDTVDRIQKLSSYLERIEMDYCFDEKFELSKILGDKSKDEESTDDYNCFELEIGQVDGVENDEVVIETASLDQVIESNSNIYEDDSKPEKPSSSSATVSDKADLNASEPALTSRTAKKSDTEANKSNSSLMSTSELGKPITSNESSDSAGASIEDDTEDFLYHSDFSI